MILKKKKKKLLLEIIKISKLSIQMISCLFIADQLSFSLVSLDNVDACKMNVMLSCTEKQKRTPIDSSTLNRTNEK